MRQILSGGSGLGQDSTGKPNEGGTTSLRTLIAGERNQDSPTLGHQITIPESTCDAPVGITAVVIGSSAAANDTHLLGINVAIASVGTITVVGFSDPIVFPIGSIGNYNFYGAINDTAALTMTLSSATDDNRVTVFSRAV